MIQAISALQKARAAYQPKLPPALAKGAKVEISESGATTAAGDKEKIQELFKTTYGSPRLQFGTGDGSGIDKPVNVGVILSGGQAPGGHNVIAGIFDGIKSLNADSKLYGFKGGPSGLTDNEYMEITSELIDQYRNTGGFDIIGSGRTKLETVDQFEKAKENLLALEISAIVIIGGDDSNTNACLLAEVMIEKSKLLIFSAHVFEGFFFFCQNIVQFGNKHFHFGNKLYESFRDKHYTEVFSV